MRPTVLIINEIEILKTEPEQRLLLILSDRSMVRACPDYPYLQQKLWGIGRSRGRLGVGDSDVRSITASFRHF